MRIMVAFVFIAIVLISCKRELIETISTYDNGKPKTIWLYPDSANKTEFWLMQYYKNGQLSAKGIVKNHKWEGHWQWWYENGKKRDSAFLVAGRYMGIRKHWFENGNLRLIEYLSSLSGNCDNCQCSGRFVHYDSLGRITQDILMDSGKFNGPQVLYYYPKITNDVTKEYREYQNDVQTGKRVEWYLDGSRTNGQYINNKEEGTWHFYKNNKEYCIKEYKLGKIISGKNFDTLATKN